MGKTLISDLTEATGLPKDLVEDELRRLLGAAGVSESSLTLDELRNVLAQYVQDVLVEAKEQLLNDDAL